MDKLPDVWYIKTEASNNKIICDWFDKSKNCNTDRSIGNYYGMEDGKYFGWMYHAHERAKNLITFEQFERLVLKKNVSINNYSIF